MERKAKILIADRNSRVREFLKREMQAEGYQVMLADSGRQLLKWVFHYEPIDLLILDPDLPDVEGIILIKRLKNRIPFLPIVFHAFASDAQNFSDFLQEAVFVEKRGSSIERLKQVVKEILHKNAQKKSDRMES